MVEVNGNSRGIPASGYNFQEMIFRRIERKGSAFDAITQSLREISNIDNGFSMNRAQFTQNGLYIFEWNRRL